MTALHRLHNNLGHPENGKLCRALQHAGALPTVIEATRTLTCDLCLEHQPQKARMPARLLGSCTQFGQGIGLDLSSFADSQGAVFTLLNVVDIATKFGIVLPVISKRPDDVLNALETGWLSWAGPLSIFWLILEENSRENLLNLLKHMASIKLGPRLRRRGKMESWRDMVELGRQWPARW